MDDDPKFSEQAPPQEWLDALARGEADIAAGRIVPWSEARARLLAILDDSEADPTERRA
jgi:predicted transcriptional regulator